MRVHRALLALAILLLCLPAAAQGSRSGLTLSDSRSEGRQGQLALVSLGTTSELVRLDARSLQPIAGVPRVPVGLHDIPWATPPDGSTLAIGSGRTGSLLFVDLDTMRVLGRLRTAFTSALAWPSPRRVLLLEQVRARKRLVLGDPATRRVLSRRQFDRGRAIVAAAVTSDGLALLLAPRARVGAPWLVVLDQRGHVRRIALKGIAAGFARADRGGGRPGRVWYRSPGLAVDAQADRAYVVPAGATRVIEVDLETLGLTIHTLQPARSLAHMSRAADGGNVLTSGTQRQALWLGHGLVAVSGWDDRVVRDPNCRRVQTDAPAGLSILDTHSWTVRLVADDVRCFHATADLVLAFRTPTRLPGTALEAFTHEGESRYRLELSVVSSGIQIAGQYAYMGLGDAYREHSVTVVDTRLGQVVDTPRVPGWVLLVSASQPQFCWCYTGTTVG